MNICYIVVRMYFIYFFVFFFIFLLIILYYIIFYSLFNCRWKKFKRKKKCTRTKEKFIYSFEIVHTSSFSLLVLSFDILSEIVIKNIHICDKKYSYIFAYWICEYRPDVHSARLSTWSHGRIETVRFIIYDEDTYSLVNKCL